MKTAVVCDHRYKRLECSADALLDIRVAVFGDHGIDMSSVLKAGCFRPRGREPCIANVSSTVQSMCQNRRSCSLFSEHSKFNVNPCPGHPKYLFVRYNCRRGAVLRNLWNLLLDKPRLDNKFVATTIYGTANESTDTTQAFASSTASLENLQTINWATSTAGGRVGGERNIGAIIGGVIAGCLIFLLTVAAIIALVRRRNASKTGNGHGHHQSLSANDAPTQVQNEKMKVTQEAIAGDSDYEESDKFSPEIGQSLQDMPGYETVVLRPGDEAYADYDTSHRQISDTDSYITPPAVPGNDGYKSPQTMIHVTRQRLESIPGYETVDSRVGDEAYADYDTSHRQKSDIDSYITPPAVPGNDGYKSPQTMIHESRQRLESMPGYETADSRVGDESYTAYDTSYRRKLDGNATSATVSGNGDYEEISQCIRYEPVDSRSVPFAT